MRWPLAILALALAAVTLLGAPRGFVSGDSGVKLVQAHDLWASGFTSRALRGDPAFAGYRRVGGAFERRVGTEWQGIYSIVFVAPAALLTGVLGRAGIPILPLAGALLALFGLARLLEAWKISRGVSIAALCASAFATPLLLYSSQFFEHSLATGLVTLALAELARARRLTAGLLVALAATLRPECYCAVAALGIASLFAPGPRIRGAWRYLAGALAVLVPFWLLNHVTAGAWDPLVVTDHGYHQSAANALVMLWGEIPKASLWPWLVPLALPIGFGLAGRRGPIAIVGAALLFTGAGWDAATLSHARILDGLFAVTPLLGLGLLAGPRRAAWIFAILFIPMVVALDKSGTGGGLQLGARLLLPAVPALIALAASVVDAHRGIVTYAAAAVVLAASVVIDARGMWQAAGIADAGAQATAWATAGPGHMIVTKLDWQAGVLAPAVLDGKDVIISHNRNDAGIFRVLARRGDRGCVYVSPKSVHLPFARTIAQHATVPRLVVVQAIALGAP